MIDADAWTARRRAELAKILAGALARTGDDLANAWAIASDQGLGVSAQAAIAARPRGPARAMEAAAWVARARRLGVDEIATLITPGMTDDELDAVTELHFAIAQARNAEERAA